MPDLSAAQETALAEGHVMRRLFFECEALDELGAPDTARLWDDVGPVTVESKTFDGSGTLGRIESIAATSDLSVTPMIAVLSGISPEATALARNSQIAQRPTRVWIGIYNTTTRAIVGSLIKMFEGVADDAEIKTPESGGVGSIVLTCESIGRELTIRSTDTRSHESQKKRSATDTFLKYVEGVPEWHIFFGRKSGRKHKNKKHR